jgi:hypothetical protein
MWQPCVAGKDAGVKEKKKNTPGKTFIDGCTASLSLPPPHNRSATHAHLSDLQLAGLKHVALTLYPSFHDPNDR